MPNKYSFSIHNFKNLNKNEYRQRTEGLHIFHSLEWMDVIRETLGVNHKIAILRENEMIVASIPFANYHNLFKGLCALPLQFSGYYDSIIADNNDVKKKILSQFCITIQ